MLIRHALMSVFPVSVVVLGAGVACAQTYPVKSVRIVTSGIGGANDFTARLVAHGLTSAWAQQVIVENRGGASAAISAQVVIKAPPDGYTLLSHGSPLWLLPFLQDNVPYDPLRDLSPIALIVTSPNVLVVHPSLPVKSVRELIALAKARPGALNYGTTTLGGPSHLSGELFKSMAQVRIVSVRYKGAAQSVQDLISGRVELSFPSAAAATAHVKSGRLRALAVTSAQPSALFPGLPPISASGLPGYESVGIFGIFAPAGTSANIVNRLNQDVVQVINRAEVKEKFLTVGGEVVGSSPEAFAATIKSEMARMGKVIRDAGIRAE
jgi:tripartite-type tricarboxylate transporter receptor subunit TctC